VPLCVVHPSIHPSILRWRVRVRVHMRLGGFFFLLLLLGFCMWACVRNGIDAVFFSILFYHSVDGGREREGGSTLDIQDMM
jgi:hypothetical protein